MRDIIEDELFSSTVIKDTHVLDYDFIPEELPHRLTQQKKLAQIFKPLLKQSPQNLVIQGPVGTGKTVLAKHFCNKFIDIARKQSISIEYVHINCRKRSTDAMVLIGILNHFDKRFPDRGFSVQEMLQILHKQLRRRDAQLLLVLDEADALIKKSGSDLLYNLSRFTDESMKADNPISIILISQKDVLSQVEIAALSSFKRGNILRLNKYERDELYDIITQRVHLGFHAGTVSDDSIHLLADISSEWGDARFAIELLWKSGMYADEHHVKLVVPEHVRAAKAETYSVVTETKLKNLERHQLLTLLSIAKRLEKDDTAYAITSEVEKMYAITCEEYQEKPRAHTMFWNYLKVIEGAGFITLKPSGKGQLGTTQLISLPDVPASILKDKLQGFLQ